MSRRSRPGIELSSRQNSSATNTSAVRRSDDAERPETCRGGRRRPGGSKDRARFSPDAADRPRPWPRWRIVSGGGQGSSVRSQAGQTRRPYSRRVMVSDWQSSHSPWRVSELPYGRLAGPGFFRQGCGRSVSGDEGGSTGRLRVADGRGLHRERSASSGRDVESRRPGHPAGTPASPTSGNHGTLAVVA